MRTFKFHQILGGVLGFALLPLKQVQKMMGGFPYQLQQYIYLLMNKQSCVNQSRERYLSNCQGLCLNQNSNTNIYRTKGQKQDQWLIIKQINYSKRRYQRQYEICASLKDRNPQAKNLVCIKDVWQDSLQQKRYILMKQYQQTLLQYLKKNHQKIRKKPKLGFSIFLQIINGLVQLQLKHRDLKLTNVLVDQLQDDNLKIVLCDFDSVNQYQQYLNSSKEGTQSFAAPQIRFKSQPLYTRKVDIWSLGLVTYFIFEYSTDDDLKRNFPYDLNNIHLTLQQLQQNMKKKLNCQNTPKLISLLISKMMVVDPAKRISLQELCKEFSQKVQLLINQFKIRQFLQFKQNLKETIINLGQFKLRQEEIQKTLTNTKKSYEKFCFPFYFRKVSFQKTKIYDKCLFMLYIGFDFINNQINRLIEENNRQKPEVIKKYMFDNTQQQALFKNNLSILQRMSKSQRKKQQLISQSTFKIILEQKRKTIETCLKLIFTKDQEIARNIVGQFQLISKRIRS